MTGIVLSAGALRVGFEHVGDRYVHWIETGPAESGNRRWFESIEGTANETWPASPALQNLHVEDRENQVCVALLVGMAGGSHWSMSVEADPSRGELTFDVACRTRDVPEFLGSSYHMAAERVTPQRDEPRWRLANGREELELEIDQAAGEVQVDWYDDRRLTIVPSPAVTAGPRTYRWRYQVRLSTTGSG